MTKPLQTIAVNREHFADLEMMVQLKIENNECFNTFYKVILQKVKSTANVHLTTNSI